MKTFNYFLIFSILNFSILDNSFSSECDGSLKLMSQNESLPLLLSSSPSGNYQVQVYKNKVRVTTLTNKVIEEYVLDSELFALIEDSPSWDILWSSDEMQVIISPPVSEGKNTYIHYIFDLKSHEFTEIKTPFPKNIKIKEPEKGLFKNTNRILPLNYKGMYGIEMNIVSGRLFAKKKQVLLVFSSEGIFQGVIGFNLDEGYKIAKVFQDQNNPRIIDVTFYHRQYFDYVIERWDIEQGLKVHETTSESIPNEHYSEFKELVYSPNVTKVSPTLDQYDKPWEVRSPNGEYWLRLTINNSPKDLNAKNWAIDIVRIKKSNHEDKPFRMDLRGTISTEVNFDILEMYWFNRGDILVLKTNDSQVWVWDQIRKQLLVYSADNFTLQGRQLILWSGSIQTKTLQL